MSRVMLSQDEGIEIESVPQERARESSVCDVVGRNAHGEAASPSFPAEGSSEWMLVAMVEPVMARLALPEEVGDR
jgi:hypothetical protein